MNGSTLVPRDGRQLGLELRHPEARALIEHLFECRRGDNNP